MFQFTIFVIKYNIWSQITHWPSDKYFTQKYYKNLIAYLYRSESQKVTFAVSLPSYFWKIERIFLSTPLFSALIQELYLISYLNIKKKKKTIGMWSKYFGRYQLFIFWSQNLILGSNVRLITKQKRSP